MIYPTNTILNEKKLFDEQKIFNDFKLITQERKEQINLLSEQYKQGLVLYGKKNYLLNENYYIYANTLNYLVNDKYQLMTKDEKILFLINTIDPNCNIYETYLNFSDDLNNETKINVMKNIFGFFSPYLLKYEYYYINNVQKRLLINVNKDYLKNFMILAPMVKNFDEVSDKRFKQIQEQVELYKEIPNINLNYQTCIYNILYQSNILELNSMQEKVAFFINAIDPELTLLKIYSEESNYSNIQKRSIEEFGFFYKYLIKIELLYYKRFCPNKKLSYWSLEQRPK